MQTQKISQQKIMRLHILLLTTYANAYIIQV